jgi:hypothetical protein
MRIPDGGGVRLKVRENRCSGRDAEAPLREKLEWLEDAETLTLRLRASRAALAIARQDETHG